MFGPYGDAVLLGIVQGITEFLPISSDGHLALAELLFRLETGGLTFNVMLHAGTLLATLIMLRERVGRAVSGGLRSVVAPRGFRETPGGRDALTVILVSLPTAVIGFSLRDPVERWTQNPLAIGFGFLATTAVLMLAHLTHPGDEEVPTVRGALLVGLAQGLAVLPGLSRSGSTIAVLLLLGVRRERAFELSMLVSLPAVFGALLLESRHAFAAPFAGGPAVLGAVVAFGAGVLALDILRRLVVVGAFGWFAFWVGPLALATIGMGIAWPSP